MDAHRFDALTRALGAASSRRRSLVAVVGSALGLLAPGPVGNQAAARTNDKHKKNKRRREREVGAEGPCGNGGAKKNRCKRDKQCCTDYCKKGRCRCRKDGQSCSEDRNCCPRRTGRSCVEGTCQPPTCAETCQAGCCASETCEPGTSLTACGANGEPCQVCETGLQCLQGICDCGTGTVCAVGCPYLTLQDAIDDPNGPDTIDLCATTFAGPFIISRDLTINGAGDGTDGSILDGQGGGSAVTVTDGVTATLAGLRIIGGSGNVSNDGGGIANHGHLTLTSCTVTDNHVIDDGGGIQNSSTLILTDSTVTDNTADDGGGIHNTGTVAFAGNSCVENNDPSNCVGVTCPAC